MSRALTLLLLLALPVLAPAHQKAHVHGQGRLEVVVDGPLLSIALESPLDGIVGFEHPPRTAAQKQAAAQALALLKEPARLFTLPAEAGCRAEATEVVAPVLEGQASKDGHGDLDARWSFRCTAPDQLATLEQGLFAAFPRLVRLDVQVAGPKGQRKQTLRKPERAVRL
jgi:hypothetical protein